MHGVESVSQEAEEAPEQHQIMVVDDDPTNRLVLGAIVRKAGYQPLLAENGQEAITLFEAHRPLLVLMDIMMPEMNGYTATREIKARAGDEFVPVIFLTALNDEDALAECVRSGGDDFLTKPSKHVLVQAKIEAQLRNRALYATVKRQRDALHLHHERLRHEHDVAERLFANLQQPSLRERDNIRYHLSPVESINGDLILAANKTPPCEHYLLGDFTGHGLSAAIGAIPVSDIFYSMTRKGFHLAEVAREINRKLGIVLPTGLFLAACLVEVDHARRTVTVWNGGVPDLLVCGPEGIRGRVTSTHLPLGILADDAFDYSMEVLPFRGDEWLYLYSDGVTEAADQTGEMFGQERLERLFAEPRSDGWFLTLRDTVETFRDGAEPGDDLTLLEIRLAPQRPTTADSDRAAWRFGVDLNGEVLRNFDPLEVITRLLEAVSGLESHRERLYMLVAELYNNALEHGVLRLETAQKEDAAGFSAYYTAREERLQHLEGGWIKLEVRYHADADNRPAKVVVRVEDSGEGFDHQDLPPELGSNRRFSGRGIQLLRSFCSALHFYGRGNCVEAIYTLSV